MHLPTGIISSSLAATGPASNVAFINTTTIRPAFHLNNENPACASCPSTPTPTPSAPIFSPALAFASQQTPLAPPPPRLLLLPQQPWRPPPTSTSIKKPTVTDPPKKDICEGVTKECKKYVKVTEGDICQKIVKAVNVKEAEFEKWNDITDGCDDLNISSYVCVKA